MPLIPELVSKYIFSALNTQMKKMKKLQKLLQKEKDQKEKQKMTAQHCRRSSNSKMQNNADHLISLWTHMYWSV